MLNGKKILVVGGAGFIGSHLSEALLKSGASVVIIDDFSNGTMSNLEPIKDRVIIIRYDVSRAFSGLRQAVKDYKFDGDFPSGVLSTLYEFKKPVPRPGD